MPYKNVEIIKWIALILMVGDHINKYLLNDTVPFIYNVGRIAMPLFCFTLAYNLARPGSLEKGVYIKVFSRLLFFGLLATPAYIMLGGVINKWWPLNILFTLQAVTIICYFLDLGKKKDLFFAFLIFCCYGSVVEFWWPAIAIGVSTWLFYKKEKLSFAIIWLISCLLLAVINQNFYALLSIPVILFSGCVYLRTPRLKWFFYAFYPAHLYLILALQLYLMRKGYLFFT